MTYKGVSFNKNDQEYEAYKMTAGKKVYKGSFITFRRAVIASGSKKKYRFKGKCELRAIEPIEVMPTPFLDRFLSFREPITAEYSAYDIDLAAKYGYYQESL